MNDPFDFSHFENHFQQQTERKRELLNLRFYIEPVQNKGKSEAAGRPIFDNIEFVAINVPGSRDEVVKKVTDDIKQRFGPQYAYWIKTQEQPVDGTPLALMPFLNPGLVKELAALNIHTVEQLAGLTDTAVQRFGMGGVELRKKAQAYIETMSKGADTATVQKLLSENETLRRDLAAMQQQITQVNQRYEALLGAAPGQPRPSVTPEQVNGLDIAALIRAEVAKMKEQL